MRLNPYPRRFRQWCRWFRSRVPLDRSIVVRRTRYKPGGALALAIDHGSGHGYEIRIWAGLCRSAQWDALAHEWAHLYRDEHHPPDPLEREHDEKFWDVQGEIYRAWERGEDE